MRLERQAKLYGFEDDRKHLSLSPTDQILDAGCGSGAITRAIARDVPNGKAYGVDREPKHIDYAKRKAASENIGNIRFEVGDILNLPFESDSFDVVWSKHVLQFIRERDLVLAEYKRVLRPGGRIVCCNYDGFCASHYPNDVNLQRDLDLLFGALAKELGMDFLLGRKLPVMFLETGLIDVNVDIIPDRVLGGFGGDPEKKWNLEVQAQAVIGFSAKVFGSMERAQLLAERFIEHFSRPDVYHPSILYYVEGRKP